MIIRVSRKNGERTRQKLIELGLLDSSRKIKSDKRWVYIGVRKALTAKELKRLGAEKSRAILKKSKSRYTNLQKELKGKLTKKELEILPSSLDIIGEVAVLLIPRELKRREKAIANAILKVHKNVRTVAKRIEKVSGRFRIRPFRIIAGSRDTETEHREHGCRYRVDPRYVFFTPRLATERLRIANQVKKGEKVLDMFTGVGPFAILIAKKKRAKVWAVDLNPKAVGYLRENILLNKVADLVTPVQGDAKRVKVPKMGRIIMNLPKSAIDFIPAALKIIRKGGVVNYHCFAEEGRIEEKVEEVREKVEEKGFRFVLLGKRKVRQISPKEWNLAVDFRVG